MACCRENHEERWGFHSRCVDFVGELYEICCTFIDEFVATQLYLDKSIRTIAKMYYCVAFQPRLVAEMIDFTIKNIREHAEVSYT